MRDEDTSVRLPATSGSLSSERVESSRFYYCSDRVSELGKRVIAITIIVCDYNTNSYNKNNNSYDNNNSNDVTNINDNTYLLCAGCITLNEDTLEVT